MLTDIKLKSFTERALKELQYDDTSPQLVRRTLRLIESVTTRAVRQTPVPANDDRPVSPQWGNRALNDSEVSTLSALIAFQADQAGWTPDLVTNAVECSFAVENIGSLLAWQFDEAVRYLMQIGSQS